MLRLSRWRAAGLFVPAPALLALVLLSACAAPDSDDPVALGSPGAVHAASAPETYLWGTGFFIDHDGTILTARHVVKECARIDVVAEGHRKTATLLASSGQDDLSLLRIDATVGEPLSIAPADQAVGGAFVAVVGYASLDAAAQASAFNSMVIPGGTPRHIALASDAAPGYSGSPVVGMDGRVVGLLESKLIFPHAGPGFGYPREVRLAVDSDAVSEFLRSQHIATDSDPPTPFDTIGARLAAAEVKVECHGVPQSVLLSQLP